MIGVLVLTGLLLTAEGGQPKYWEGPTSGYEILYEAKRGMRPPSMPEDRADEYGYDVLHYGIDVTIGFSPNSLIGTVSVQAAVTDDSLSQVVLDFYSNMTVDEVRVGLSAAAFTHANDLLTVELPSTVMQGDEFVLSVSYHGLPYEGMFFSTHAGEPTVYTTCQTAFSRAWWPCKDVPWDKAPATITVTVPDDKVVASNGTLDSTIVDAGQATYYWTEHYPIPPYLVAVTATNFEILEDWYTYGASDSMPLRYWVYPEHLTEAQFDFSRTPDMIGFYEQRFIPYPFLDEKYGVAIFEAGGGMEHQTVTSIGSGQIAGDLSYEWLYAHELSHMWWGDMLTCGTWKDLWLNEGFAVYCDALYTGDAHGYGAFRARMRQFRQAYFDEDANQGRFAIYDPEYLWGATVYEKGAWVLHMLRGVVGEESFWSIFPAWADSFAYGSAVTADFQELCESVCGEDLAWFFDQWIYQAGYPEYEYDYDITTDGSAWAVELHLNQVQQNAPVFTMPVHTLVISTAGDSLEATLQSQTAADTFVVPCVWQPQKVVLDPDAWILKTIRWTDTYMLGGQVADAETGTPVEGAIVELVGPFPPEAGIETSVGVHNDTTEADGVFSVLVQGGLYTGSAWHPDYVPSPDVVVDLCSDTTDVWIPLLRPEISVSPESIVVTADVAGCVTTYLDLEHGGFGPLVYSVTELPPVPTTSEPGTWSPVTLLPLDPDEWHLGHPDLPKMTAQPTDTGWIALWVDQEDHPQATTDLGEIAIQEGGSDLFFRVKTHHPWNIPAEFQIILMLDTDADQSTGSGMLDMGVDRLIAVSDFKSIQWGLFSLLLFWDPQYQGWAAQYPASWPSYQNVLAEADSFVVGFPLSNVGVSTKLDMAVWGVGLRNIVFDRDGAPDANLGHFSYSRTDLPWLSSLPRFGMLSDGQRTLEIHLNTLELTPGIYEANLCLDNNEPGRGPIMIPVKLTYGTAGPDEPTPTRWALRVMGPNPLREQIGFELSAPTAERLTMRVYDLTGRVVSTLLDGRVEPGRHAITWQCSQTPPGLYVCRLDSGPFGETLRLVVAR
jgi:aminopeptidase N